MDVREKLVELLAEYFNIGDSYAYNLTRVKSAFACGTVGLDDFEEFDDETVEDIASYLTDNGVTVQEWVSVKDRLPEDSGYYLVVYQDKYNGSISTAFDMYVKCKTDEWWENDFMRDVTHWMPIPQPPKGE